MGRRPYLDLQMHDSNRRKLPDPPKGKQEPSTTHSALGDLQGFDCWCWVTDRNSKTAHNQPSGYTKILNLTVLWCHIPLNCHDGFFEHMHIYIYIYIISDKPEKRGNESQQPPDERVKRRNHLSNTCLLGRWQALYASTWVSPSVILKYCIDPWL